MKQFLDGDWGRGSLIEYVFLEVATVLLVRRDLATSVRLGQLLLNAEELDFVPCSDLFPEIMTRFSRQAGTRLNFADAAIAHVARTRAEGQVLTFDGEFRKIAGLRVLPG